MAEWFWMINWNGLGWKQVWTALICSSNIYMQELCKPRLKYFMVVVLRLNKDLIQDVQFMEYTFSLYFMKSIYEILTHTHTPVFNFIFRYVLFPVHRSLIDKCTDTELSTLGRKFVLVVSYSRYRSNV